MNSEQWNWHALLELFPVRTVQAGTARLSYRAAGAGDDIVLLHGIGSGSGSWVHQFQALQDNFRLTAWDAPGYGASDHLSGPDPALESWVLALHGMLDALDISAPVLVGHSLGALIAARFAKNRPDRVSGLVLADPAQGHSKRARAERNATMTERLERFERLGAVAHAQARAPALLSDTAGPEALALVMENMSHLRSDGYATAAGLLRDGALLEDVASIDCDALVLCGSADRITPPPSCREVAAAFPEGCAYTEIEGAGHASYIEQPSAFNNSIRQFAEGRR